jgi:hypothetical protein
MNKLFGIYLAVVGAAVAVQFVLYPLYGSNSDAGLTIWLVLDWFMAIGLVLALVTTNQRRRMGNGNSCCFNGADIMFYGTAILALAFFPNWFGEVFDGHPNADAAWTIWHLIDSVLPVIFITEGRRLLRTS